MNPRLGMLAHIHEQPDDELPRLAYADWLEENGEDEHAEFVRGQLWLHAHGKDAPGGRAVWDRELDLIRRNKDAWFGTFRHGWSYYEVRRGFIDEVCSHAEQVVPHLAWLREHHAVQRLVVGDENLARLPHLLHSPLVATLRELSWVFVNQPLVSAYRPVPPLEGASLPLARRPLDVQMANLRAGPGLVRMLADSTHLERLARLDLSLNRLGEEGARALMEAMARWPRLDWLVVRAQGNTRQSRRMPGTANLRPAGVAAIALHPAAARLRVLDLLDEELTSGAIRALAESPHLEGLRELHLLRPQEHSTRALERRSGDRLRWVE